MYPKASSIITAAILFYVSIGNAKFQQVNIKKEMVRPRRSGRTRWNMWRKLSAKMDHKKLSRKDYQQIKCQIEPYSPLLSLDRDY